MFAYSIRRLVLAISLGTATLPCHAQDGSEVTLRFLSFPKSNTLKPVELLVGDNKTIKVEISSNELSPSYKVPNLAAWVVGETAKGEDGKPAFKEFGKAKSLAVPNQLILLVRKGENYTDGMAVVPIPNDIASFGGGKFLFVNASKLDVAGEVGGVKFALKPGQNIIVKPKADSDGRAFFAALYYRNGEEAKPFLSTKWPASDDARGLIFFYNDPETEQLRLHTIQDFL